MHTEADSVGEHLCMQRTIPGSTGRGPTFEVRRDRRHCAARRKIYLGAGRRNAVGPRLDRGVRRQRTTPWHCLYRFPLRHGQGAFRKYLGTLDGLVFCRHGRPVSTEIPVPQCDISPPRIRLLPGSVVLAGESEIPVEASTRLTSTAVIGKRISVALRSSADSYFS